MASDGSFIIAWSSRQDQDGDKEGVYAQRFNADGTPQSRPGDAYGDGSEYANPYEFRVNQTTDRFQDEPSVAIRSDGSFVVAWTSRTVIGGIVDSLGVRYSVFNADGTRLTNPAWTMSDTATDEDKASVAVNPTTNEMVIAFTRNNGDGEIQIRRLNADGSHNGSRTALTTPGEMLDNPSVAMNGSGEIVVVGQTDADRIVMWRLNSDGTLMGGPNPVQVNQTTTDKHENPDVTLQDDGDILVTWQSDQGTGDEVYARQFRVNGLAVGQEVLVNETTASNQRNPAVISHGNTATVAWNGEGSGDNDGIFVRALNIADPGATILVTSTLQTSETGDFVNVSVTLDSQPVGDVTITIGVDDATEGSVTSGGTMTFTTANWNVTQVARVTGVDDAIVDGDVTYQVTVDVTSAADPLYDGMVLTTPIILTNVDDDVAPIGNVSDTNTDANQVAENSGSGTSVGITAQAIDPIRTTCLSLTRQAELSPFRPRPAWTMKRQPVTRLPLLQHQGMVAALFSPAARPTSPSI
jgi:hypothetical protein